MAKYAKKADGVVEQKPDVEMDKVIDGLAAAPVAPSGGDRTEEEIASDQDATDPQQHFKAKVFDRLVMLEERIAALEMSAAAKPVAAATPGMTNLEKAQAREAAAKAAKETPNK